MTKDWTRLSERGNPQLMSLFAWFILKMGRSPARMVLHFICIYYFLCSKAACQASRKYLAKVLPYRPSWLDIYRHFFAFSSTLLDRTLFLAGRVQDFDLQVHGSELILKKAERNEGCLLLGSHLGSFEVARILGTVIRPIPLKVLMYEENAHKINRVFQHINPTIAESVIPIKTPDSLLRVKECVANGIFVGILGDRVFNVEKTTHCDFLGERAAFPTGPLLLASVLKVPVVLFFGLYLGKNRYSVHFELLADRIELACRRSREEQLKEWTERYVRRLEAYCRLAPFNWFNFYDYWNV